MVQPDVKQLKHKLVMEQNQQVCLICHDGLQEVRQVVRLLPCEHKLCQTCFQKYFEEVEKNKCPTCILPVKTYQILDLQQQVESPEIDFKEMKKESSQEKQASFDCLDHGYFLEEARKLAKLRDEIEHDRFFRRYSQSMVQMQGSEIEWESLKQIEKNIREVIKDLEDCVQFDPDKRVVEFTEMTETLNKIKSGKFAEELGLNQVEIDPYEDQYEEDYADYFQDENDEELIMEKKQGGRRKGGQRRREKKQVF